MARTIFIKLTDGSEQRVSGVPDDARITFAKANPANGTYHNDPYALRIYAKSTGQNQIACILGVAEFWDTALTVEKRATQVTKKSTRKERQDGVTFDASSDVVFEWQPAGGNHAVKEFFSNAAV